MWPFSSRVYQSVLTPARTATSSRRNPGTRRRPPPGSKPARSGVIRARRLARKSRMSERLSTPSTLRPPAGRGRSSFYPPQARPPTHVLRGVPWEPAPGRPPRRPAHEPLEVVDVSSKVFLITGAGRGMGVDFARAALAAGHSVVATGRRPDAVEAAIGAHADLLAVTLDVTRPEDVEAAVAAAVERFGRIDVLINNAGNFQAGFFEEISPEQFRAQQEVNLFGPVAVTRAVLPLMRAQRSGMV